jgi:hypothetical protein
MAVTRGQRTRRTWSLLEGTGRKPSAYEVVTARLHYHFGRQPAPFELSPDTAINRWYLEHREGSKLRADDWEGFRDPQRLVYRGYVALQHRSETVLEGLVDDFERREHDARLDPSWVDLLARLYVPSRFPIHALQMTGLYVGQMAPSSFVANAAYFQAADELRRVQWVAYRSRSLALAHGPELASSEMARLAWEDDPLWQPLRRAVETMLVAYDWGESFAALDLAVKPLFDAICNRQLAELARRNRDELLALMLDQFDLDSRRSGEWSRALVAYALERRPENREVLGAWVERWRPVAEEAADAVATVFADAPVPMDPDEVRRQAREAYREHLAACGL